jgi:hypothetical protein
MEIARAAREQLMSSSVSELLYSAQDAARLSYEQLPSRAVAALAHGRCTFFFLKLFFLLTITHPIMPNDTNSHNIYKFTVSPQLNSNMCFSFTPVLPGEIVRMMSFSVSAGVDHHLHQTIDITVGPAANGLTTSSDRTPISPPQYSSGSSSVPKAAAPPYASMSSHQKPSLPPGIRPFDLMPTQLQ